MVSMNLSQSYNLTRSESVSGSDNHKKVDFTDTASLVVLSWLAVKMLHRVVAALRSSP